MEWLREQIEERRKLIKNEIKELETCPYRCDIQELDYVLFLIDQANCTYTLEDKEYNLYKCSNCELEWDLNNGTPLDNEMNYCPKCGYKIKE